ncbi:alpha/beta fold hydrolase [Phytoactinopolyspora halotolerans]|uniref:Serine aminopeptidase S33 domain-containing protein n=1 Tax=Phytoactinopolyspora halotolerans TaxID=1981512 RepID=A0A6L9SF88_9ACTN|nr:alpha/beta hydrolase [Phytoactinopolyspora halotolerans]NEE02700.1 hypothetical protein [Phytoactinopolyspora halotolerans]
MVGRRAETAVTVGSRLRPAWAWPVTALASEQLGLHHGDVLVDDVRELLADLESELDALPAVIYGHSAGGGVAAAVVAARRAVDPAIARSRDTIPSPPWPEAVEKITAAGVPLLVVTGARKTGMTAEHQRMITDRGGRVEVIDGASHFVRRDAPEQFMALAEPFIAQAFS